MTYSPLTDERMPPTGKYQGGVKWQARPSGVRINGLNVHHHAATSDAGIYRLVTSNDPASANYIIRNNGSLIGSVPEEYRAWTTSAYANDDDKITVEIQNETGAPSWRISDKAMSTLIRLYADLAKRYKFPPDRAHLKGHQEYGIATACPGPYLLPRLDDVARKAAALTTTTAQEDDVTLNTTQATQLSNCNHFVTAKIIPDFDGNQTVEDALRRLLILARRNAAALEAQSAAMGAMAKSVGVDPALVVAAVEKAVTAALPTSVTIPLES